MVFRVTPQKVGSVLQISEYHAVHGQVSLQPMVSQAERAGHMCENVAMEIDLLTF